MSGRCGHVLRLRALRVKFAPGVESPYIDRNRRTGEPIRSVIVDACRCLDCGAWLPLGHSDETPERVAVEIRAAEIAAAFTKERGTADDATIDENAGWLVHLNEWTHLDRDRGFPVNDEQQTGWLAREIATHKETP